MYSAENIKEITTDLYYDLLDKYVALNADHKKAKDKINGLEIDNSQMKLELAMYRNHSMYPHELIKGAYKAFVKQVMKIIRSKKRDEAIKEIQNLIELK